MTAKSNGKKRVSQEKAVFAIGMTLLVAACGGGGNNSTILASPVAPTATPPTTAGPGSNLRECTQADLTEANFERITSTTTVQQALDIIGCAPDRTRSFGLPGAVPAQNIALTWIIGRPNGSITAQTGLGFAGDINTPGAVVNDKQYWADTSDLSQPLPDLPTPVTAACTGAQLNQANFNRLNYSMSPDLINQTIGCRPLWRNLETRYDIPSNGRTPAVPRYATAAYSYLAPGPGPLIPLATLSVSYDSATKRVTSISFQQY